MILGRLSRRDKVVGQRQSPPPSAGPPRHHPEEWGRFLCYHCSLAFDFLNLLSVGAAYGLLVLVTQEGVGAGLFGFQQVESIEAWLPTFLFAILFGLSMDYHVFLLSRIRERYDQTGDNTDAVVFGVRPTGRLITGAALIMVAVFGGFAAGDLVMFQEMGFGAGVAVLILKAQCSTPFSGRTTWTACPTFHRSATGHKTIAGTSTRRPAASKSDWWSAHKEVLVRRPAR